MNNMEDNISFFQGQQDYFQESNEDNKLETIKAKIAEFFNMKNVHFLFGSGVSCPTIPNMSGLFKCVKNELISKDELDKIFVRISNKNGENLEEVLGVLYSQKIYLEGIEDNLDNELHKCTELIEIIESTIFNKINIEKDDMSDTIELYKSFYQKLALRNKDLSRINVFTTNNDLFNETALDQLNIHYINGFSGGLHKYFNPAFFNYTYSKRMDTSIDKFEPVENVVYLYKIHGSINWIEDEDNLNSYFKIREVVPPLERGKNILIYPTPTKQEKSLGSPYVDLFREFQHKLIEPNSVLFVIGYSFSDEHVNNIIYRALATNSTINIIVINKIDNNKAICKIDDNRIFRLFGTIEKEGKTKNIHYFDYIVKELIPNLDAFKQEDKNIENIISELNRINNEGLIKK